MYIRVHAVPGAKKEIYTEKSEDTVDISVREPAEGNRANRRIIELLKEHYGTNAVRLISGHHSRSKLFSIDL